MREENSCLVIGNRYINVWGKKEFERNWERLDMEWREV